MSLTKIVNGERVEMTPEEEQEVRSEWSANEQEAKQEREDRHKLKHLTELRESILDRVAAGEDPIASEQVELKELMQKRGRT